MRRADAVLQALIMMSSSMTPSLMSPGAVDCRMKTIVVKTALSDSCTATITCIEIWREWRVNTIFVAH